MQIGLRDKARSLGWSEPVVITEDLGVSAAGYAERAGCQRLVAEVSLQRVGIILCLEASRLSRNSKDWAQLFEVCGYVKTLVADADQVYDLAIANDPLLLGIKGTVSEYELELLRQRSAEAIDAMAKRGELQFALPADLCWNDGKIELAIDQRIQQAIRMVFDKFEQLGSARQVLMWLREHDLSMPTPGFPGTGQVRWCTPTYRLVLSVVRNPLNKARAAPRCIGFTARRIDEAVRAAVVNAVQGQALQAAIEAAAMVEEQVEQQRSAVALELEQARYEAELARRRYESVDPQQRLVAAELEARWNATLQRVEQIEQRLEATTAASTTANPVDRRTLESLAQDLKMVWDTTDAMPLKQRIVRLLMQEIVADIDTDTGAAYRFRRASPLLVDRPFGLHAIAPSTRDTRVRHCEWSRFVAAHVKSWTGNVRSAERSHELRGPERAGARSLRARRMRGSAPKAPRCW